MTAKSIKNIGETNFPLPSGGTLPPGATGRIENWEVAQHNDTLKQWYRAGMLEVTDAARQSTKETGPSQEEAENLQKKAEQASVREDAKVTAEVRSVDSDRRKK